MLVYSTSQMRMFCSWDFIVKYIIVKHEKVAKHNFKPKKLGKSVSYKTKRSKRFAILIVNQTMILASQMCESGSETVDKYILGKIYCKYSKIKNWQKDKFCNLRERRIFMKQNEVGSLRF